MRQRAEAAPPKVTKAVRRTPDNGSTIAPVRNPDFNGLLAEPRRMKILDWLQEEGSARVRDLAPPSESPRRPSGRISRN